MNYEVTVGERTLAIDVRPHREGGWWVAVDGGEARHVTGSRIGTAEWLLAGLGEQGATQGIGVHMDGGRFDAQLHGRSYTGRVVDPRKDALAFGAGAAAGAVATQMPGAVVRVLVTEGQEVVFGEPVCVVEAMKMENEFKAPCDGLVQIVHVSAGQAVESGALLVTIAPSEGA